MTQEVRFAHASEAELARILDYYGVVWQYEPQTFPIMWNLDGLVVESFAPDFYLPEADLYVELTTLKQSLVRRKNRKLRRLRELYPDIRIKLFYGKDFKALMLKYGRLELAASLTGLEGQALVSGASAAPVLASHGRPGAPSTGQKVALDGQARAAMEMSAGRRHRRPSRGSRRRRGRRIFAAHIRHD